MRPSPSLPHEDYLNAMPAYLAGEMRAEAREDFSRHVRQCPSCAEQLLLAKALRQHYAREFKDHSLSEELAILQEPARIDANFERLWQRIETSPPRHRRATEPWRWTLSALAASLLLMLGAWWVPPAGLPLYHTLADSTTPRLCGQIRVRFEDPIDADEMQHLLRIFQAQIVQGPTPHGIYTLHAADPGTALEGLRQQSSVLLAEPVGC